MPGTRGLATNPPTSSTAISTLSLSASRRRLRYTANRRTATDNDAAKCASVASRPSSPRWSTRSSQPRCILGGAVIRSYSRRSYSPVSPGPTWRYCFYRWIFPIVGVHALLHISFFVLFSSLKFEDRSLDRRRFEKYIYICCIYTYIGWIIALV